jgi:hypothetical protein
VKEAAVGELSDDSEVYECTFCDTQFERGVADPGPNGEPRCPQCLLYLARPILEEEAADFIVTRSTRFR